MGFAYDGGQPDENFLFDFQTLEKVHCQFSKPWKHATTVLLTNPCPLRRLPAEQRMPCKTNHMTSRNEENIA